MPVNRKRSINNIHGLDLTGAQDGDVIAFDNADKFIGSLSPLSFGGTDYKNPAFGGSVTPSVILMTDFSAGPSFIEADGEEVGIDSQLATGDIVVALCTPGGGPGLPFTIYMLSGFATLLGEAETKSGYQTALRNVSGDAGLVIDNFKIDYFSYVGATSDYTHNGFTGFSDVGAVTVVTGETTPPTVTYQPGKMVYVPMALSLPLHVEFDNSNSVNTVTTATPTLLDVADSGANGSALPYWTDENPNEIAFNNGISGYTNDLRIVIQCWDNAGEWGTPIDTGIIELQRDTGIAFETIAKSTAGNPLTAVINGATSENFKVRFTHTEGSDTDVIAQFDAFHATPLE